MKKVTYTYFPTGSSIKHTGIVFVNDDSKDEVIRDIVNNVLGFKLEIEVDSGYVYHGNGVYEKLMEV